MRILALDTATVATTVAVVDFDAGGAPLAEFSARDDPPAGSRPGHATTLLTLTEEALTAAGGGWASVDRIAVGLGPGTFTGLRIGVATAQALALSTGIELVGVSTLDALVLGAQAAGIHEALPVLAVIDARRGEVFTAGPGVAPQVLAPDALAAPAAGRLAVGDGAIQFRATLERAGARVPSDASDLHRVDAVWHCRLGLEADPGPVNAVQPVYMRQPDAELTR